MSEGLGTTTYWDSLGFDYGVVDKYEDFINLIVRKAQTEVRSEKPEDWETCCYYVDPSGVIACVFMHKNGISDTNFGIFGQPGTRFYTFQVTPGLGAGQYLLPDPNSPNDPEAVVGSSPFFLEYLDPLAYPLPVGEIDGRFGQTFADYRLSAVATQMEVYADLDTWAQKVLDTSRLDPKDYLSVLGEIDSPSIEYLDTIEDSLDKVHGGAILGGICLDVEERTNALTGNKWLCATLDQGQVQLKLALPANISPRPVPGNVIFGRAILSGATERWEEGLKGLLP
ncbi:hypothetical protein BK816_01215 [Boudabousia tangfeifanii]|uniref:Uncharacterized protein n=1 Tax=Boudabousia tangfeifanii TaxID=1912795 RepID=A0A1D9MIR5_9ACTO|nr:hypothetical protein [Boudabousia tangfeifanii]AOZ72083.1 hypothetical protein BK816_01215 [Boudabousia tangfeifanii]